MDLIRKLLLCMFQFSSQSAMVTSTASSNVYNAMCKTHKDFSTIALVLINGEHRLTS